MTLAEYMTLKCICGNPRSLHAHAHTPDGELHVVGIMTYCRAFTWEMERELGGNPFENKHLAPLMGESD